MGHGAPMIAGGRAGEIVNRPSALFDEPSHRIACARDLEGGQPKARGLVLNQKVANAELSRETAKMPEWRRNRVGRRLIELRDVRQLGGAEDA